MRIIQKIKSEVEDWVDFAENIWDILKDLWEELVEFLPWRKRRVEESWTALNPYSQYTFTEFPLQPTPYSEITFEERLERLGMNVEEYREILNAFMDRSLQRQKDPGAPYNKYPIVKTKFLDGYQPNKI